MPIPLSRWLHKLAVIALATIGLLSCAPKQAVKPATVTLAQSQAGLFPAWTNAAGETSHKIEIKPQPVQIERWGNENYVVLGFDHADISAVLAGVSGQLNTVYLPGPGVSGRLTVRSSRRFPEKYLKDVFLNMLEINGLTAVKQGSSYMVVPIDTSKPALASGVITQIIPLENAKAIDVADTIRDLMPRETDAVIYGPANLIIAVSTPHGMAKLINIINALDVPLSDKEKVRTFVYYVENGDAQNLADAITKAYYSEEEKTWVETNRVQPQQKLTGERFNEEYRPQSDGFAGRPTVTPYSEINALIIKGTSDQYLSLLGLLKRIDVQPKQVLIDVLEAEVKLGPDETQFGLEWLLKANAGKFGIQGGFTQGNVFVDPSTSSGLNVNPPASGGFTGSAITMGPIGSINLAAFLTALQSENRLDVLASPHVLAIDGQTANIAIGDQVPIATGLMQQPSATISNTLVSTGQIRYKTIGKLLSVTPHVTEDGKVNLKLSLEVSDLGAVVPIAGQSFQAFSAKTANTTAEVENGHTLLIGGLISETKQTTRSGVPYLSDIPILGYLFSFDTKTYEKDELIVLVTPYVISNRDEADALTSQFSDRLRIIKNMGSP